MAEPVLNESFDYSNVVPIAEEAMEKAMPMVREGVSQAAAAAMPMAERAAEEIHAQTGVEKNLAKWGVLALGAYFGWGMIKGLIKPALLIGGGYMLYKGMSKKPMSLNAVGYPRWSGR
jgi:hypothetical protein